MATFLDLIVTGPIYVTGNTTGTNLKRGKIDWSNLDNLQYATVGSQISSPTVSTVNASTATIIYNNGQSGLLKKEDKILLDSMMSTYQSYINAWI